MKKVHYSFTDSEIEDLPKDKIPLEIKIRFILNSAGFKFKDDGKLTSIINRNPEPLGKICRWYDVAIRTTYFKQEIKEL